MKIDILDNLVKQMEIGKLEERIIMIILQAIKDTWMKISKFENFKKSCRLSFR